MVGNSEPHSEGIHPRIGTASPVGCAGTSRLIIHYHNNTTMSQRNLEVSYKWTDKRSIARPLPRAHTHTRTQTQAADFCKNCDYWLDKHGKVTVGVVMSQQGQRDIADSSLNNSGILSDNVSGAGAGERDPWCTLCLSPLSRVPQVYSVLQRFVFCFGCELEKIGRKIIYISLIAYVIYFFFSYKYFHVTVTLRISLIELSSVQIHKLTYIFHQSYLLYQMSILCARASSARTEVLSERITRYHWPSAEQITSWSYPRHLQPHILHTSCLRW